MPIRAENKKLYPKDWPAISKAIRARAGDICEWDGCTACNGAPHPETGSKVVLTTAHLDHDPTNCDPANLLALCQLHHNRYDNPTRVAGRKRRAREALDTKDLLLA